MAVFNTRSCILLTVAIAAHSSATTVTPLEKVITLLKDLSEKLAGEGKRDAAEYDKFACFCKEQADEKNYAMQKSTAKIKYLSAEIEELSTAKAELEADMASLNNNVRKLNENIDRKSTKRARQHDKYLAVATDMNEAIDACKGAIESLKSSKKSMKGAKLDLTQVTSGLVQVVQRQALLSEAPGTLALLSKLDGTKGAPKFQYQSNDIIATLEDLLATFQDQKKRTDFDEFNANSDFEKVRLGLSNDVKFAGQESAEKASIADAKAESIADSSDNRGSETEDYKADKKFVERLSYECEQKASLFDQRSGTRADEITAISQATAELESGAVPNMKANRKLVGLQLSAVGRKVERPISLVQVDNSQHQAAREDASLERVHSFLNDAADRTGSGAISAVAVRVGLAAVRAQGPDGEDHFVKVRALIKDLMQKLRADALSEHNQKADCDAGIKKALRDRDSSQARIEAANAALVVAKSTEGDAEESSQELTEQIAELKKAVLEATELGNEEKATLSEQISMCDDGAASVKAAMTLLESFYSKAMLLQIKQPSAKSKSRDGNTVGDLAPDTFDNEYHGAQQESSGIIGILEVILNDFEKSSSKATRDLKDSVEGVESFKEESDTDVIAKTKQRDVTNKAAISALNVQINEIETELRDATLLLDSTMRALTGWHAMCVKGEETYEERVEKRNAEIAALKEALNMLEDWQA